MGGGSAQADADTFGNDDKNCDGFFCLVVADDSFFICCVEKIVMSPTPPNPRSFDGIGSRRAFSSALTFDDDFLPIVLMLHVFLSNDRGASIRGFA
mmetsp:Transcript_8087/g.12254  ORF Transcript_8087/g.12254 Transcript_8087/m.12254 type:complete len:96 (-) Transcript_8087:17-304(-)